MNPISRGRRTKRICSPRRCATGFRRITRRGSSFGAVQALAESIGTPIQDMKGFAGHGKMLLVCLLSLR